MGELKSAGRQAENSEWLDYVVRFGLVAYGVVHLLIAWVALQLAFGETGRSASSTGALQELASQPFGGAALWAVAVGLALLVVWRLIEAAFGHGQEDGKEKLGKQVMSLLKAVLYGALAVSALKVALGSGGGGGGGGSDTMTAKVMSWPGGQVLVGLAGVAIIGYGGFTAWRGWSERFLEHLDFDGRSGRDGAAYRMFGKFGYIAKGVAVALVGGLFVYAAITHDADKGGGLDQALHTVLRQDYGPYLLGLIAVGIGCYGLFCFARARHLKR
ncbi:DUF1206 domain-containing protein [Nocardioides sp. LHG3406-4]|uniref:DUF1206 domain-containing protein n=1 Tax=Nocardioides sp. LHG3406-4 TaxID=2804575 RepID=UPI003CE9E5C1